MPELLKNKWLSLWHRLGAAGDEVATFESLVAGYAVPPRAYHNLHHIADCLEELEPTKAVAGNLEAVEVALWFHDIVYDSKAKDNEERSAAMAFAFINGAKLSSSFDDAVKALILATKHTAPPVGADAGLIVDIDLSILGQAPETFDEYELQIRREYDWVADDAFAAGRSAVLKSFLARPAIYTTGYFHDKYEAAARKNLARSMQALGTKL